MFLFCMRKLVKAFWAFQLIFGEPANLRESFDLIVKEITFFNNISLFLTFESLHSVLIRYI